MSELTKGLSLGAKAGIAVAGVLVLLIVIAICGLIVRKRRSAKKRKNSRTARVSQHYSFNMEEPPSGRLQSKEEVIEMPEVPKATAIRYPDDEVGGRTELYY